MLPSGIGQAGLPVECIARCPGGKQQPARRKHRGIFLHVGVAILDARAQQFGGEAGESDVERRGIGRREGHYYVALGVNFRCEPETHERSQNHENAGFQAHFGLFSQVYAKPIASGTAFSIRQLPAVIPVFSLLSFIFGLGNPIPMADSTQMSRV